MSAGAWCGCACRLVAQIVLAQPGLAKRTAAVAKSRARVHDDEDDEDELVLFSEEDAPRTRKRAISVPFDVIIQLGTHKKEPAKVSSEVPGFVDGDACAVC